MYNYTRFVSDDNTALLNKITSAESFDEQKILKTTKLGKNMPSSKPLQFQPLNVKVLLPLTNALNIMTFISVRTVNQDMKILS